MHGCEMPFEVTLLRKRDDGLADEAHAFRVGNDKEIILFPFLVEVIGYLSFQICLSTHLWVYVFIPNEKNEIDCASRKLPRS